MSFCEKDDRLDETIKSLPQNDGAADTTDFHVKDVKGEINTLVDGFDVEQVNIWNEPNTESGHIVGFGKSGDKCFISGEIGDYYRVSVCGWRPDRNGGEPWAGQIHGYCNKAFVNAIETPTDKG